MLITLPKRAASYLSSVQPPIWYSVEKKSKHKTEKSGKHDEYAWNMLTVCIFNQQLNRVERFDAPLSANTFLRKLSTMLCK